MTKTTKKHFEIFKEECEKWIKKLNIDSWRIEYDHMDMDARAKYYIGVRDRCIDLCLGTDFSPNTPTDELIRKSAKHEVIHLLTAKLSGLAINRFATEDQIYEESEAVTRKLENLL